MQLESGQLDTLRSMEITQQAQVLGEMVVADLVDRQPEIDEHYIFDEVRASLQECTTLLSPSLYEASRELDFSLMALVGVEVYGSEEIDEGIKRLAMKEGFLMVNNLTDSMLFPAVGRLSLDAGEFESHFVREVRGYNALIDGLAGLLGVSCGDVESCEVNSSDVAVEYAIRSLSRLADFEFKIIDVFGSDSVFSSDGGETWSNDPFKEIKRAVLFLESALGQLDPSSVHYALVLAYLMSRVPSSEGIGSFEAYAELAPRAFFLALMSVASLSDDPTIRRQAEGYLSRLYADWSRVKAFILEECID